MSKVIPYPLLGDISRRTEVNNKWRDILYTGKDVQIIAMSIPVKRDIPLESHKVSQTITIVKGMGIATLGGKNYGLTDGTMIVIPPGVKHVISNVGDRPLKLYTIYSGVVH